MSTQNKINWITITQGWTMLLVVIGHSMLQTTNESYSNILSHIYGFGSPFRMPLFITISGYLFYVTRLSKEYPYKKMIFDKFKRLGLPYVFFTILALFLKVIFSESVTSKVDLSFNEFINAFVHPNSGPAKELWFIATIIWFFIFSPVFKLFLKNIYFHIIGFVVIILIKYNYPSYADVFCLEKAAMYALFFYIGLLLAKYKIDELLKKPFLSFILFLCIFLVSNKYNHSYTLITTILGCLFSLSMAKWLDKKIPMIFYSYRRYTYQIFLMSIFFQMGYKILYYRWLMPNYFWLSFVICTLIGLYLPVLTSIIIKKLDFRFLILITGLSNRKDK